MPGGEKKDLLRNLLSPVDDDSLSYELEDFELQLQYEAVKLFLPFP